MAGLAFAGAVVPTSYAEDEAPREVFTIESTEITESSSLAVSTTHPGLVYTTNDSGDGPTVYVLDGDNGELVGRTTLSGVEAIDIEALAVGSDGMLLVADIGDNRSERKTVTVYRIDQPPAGDRDVDADEIQLTYIDDARNAESALYDVRSGRILVVSKGFEGAQVYQTPADVFERSTARLRPVAEAPALATDATFIEDGEFAVIRTYFSAVVYTYPEWEEVVSVELPPQDQGESVADPVRAGRIWIGSEGEKSQVLEVALPDLSDEPEPSPSAQSPAPPSTDSTDQGPSTKPDGQSSARRFEPLARGVLVAAIAALLLIAGVALLIRRRH